MKKRIWVFATPLIDPALKGRARVVRENTTNRYILEGRANVEQVFLTSYYQRLINSGELTMVSEKTAKGGKK